MRTMTKGWVLSVQKAYTAATQNCGESRMEKARQETSGMKHDQLLTNQTTAFFFFFFGCHGRAQQRTVGPDGGGWGRG